MPLTIDKINTLQVEITSHCNSKCPHCPRFDNDGFLHKSVDLRHWNITQLIKNLEIEKMTGLGKIIIEGDKGDPVMHPELYDLLVHLSQAPSQPILELTTNGSIQSPSWWSKLAAIPNLIVRFSIDGMSDTNHLYRVGINFDRIVKNATAFISVGGNACMKTLLFKHNEHQVDQLIEFSKSMNFFALYFDKGAEDRFLNLPIWEVKVNGSLIHSIQPSQFSREYVQGLTVQHRDVIQYNNILNRESLISTYYNYDLTCTRLNKGRLYITYKHHVIPCCMMHNDLYLDYPSGRRLVNELVKDLDLIDLSKCSMTSILSGDFLTHTLENHFYDGPHLPICVKSCKNTIIDTMQSRQKKLK